MTFRKEKNLSSPITFALFAATALSCVKAKVQSEIKTGHSVLLDAGASAITCDKGITIVNVNSTADASTITTICSILQGSIQTDSVNDDASLATITFSSQINMRSVQIFAGTDCQDPKNIIALGNNSATIALPTSSNGGNKIVSLKFLNASGTPSTPCINLTVAMLPPPAALASFSALGLDSAIQLNWSPPSSATLVAGYLIIRKMNQTPTWTPSDGTDYVVGQSCDTIDTTVIHTGLGTSMLDAGNVMNTRVYNYAAFAYDSSKHYSPVSFASATANLQWFQDSYLKAVEPPGNLGPRWIPASGDYFGWGVAIDGDTAAVAAYLDDRSATDSGGIYVFRKGSSTWSAEAFLKAPNVRANTSFNKVALGGDTIIVGAADEANGGNSIVAASGTVPDGLTVTVTIASPAVFTTSVAHNLTVNDPILLSTSGVLPTGVGANVRYFIAEVPTTDSFKIKTSLLGAAVNSSGTQSGVHTVFTSPSSGAAYAFKRTNSNWAFEGYLKAPNAAAGDGFGTAVAYDGDTAVVSAPYEDSDETSVQGGTITDNNNHVGSGAVYVFTRTLGTWTFQAYLKAADGAAGDHFGSKIALSGNTLVISTDITVGKVYVFERTGITWLQSAQLTASNGELGDYFGHSLGIGNDKIVVGAPGEASHQQTNTSWLPGSSDNSAPSSGAAYVFYRSTATAWTELAYLKASNSEGGTGFGESVAIKGGIIVVGSPGESSHQTTVTNGSGSSPDQSAPNSGAAYIFEIGSDGVQQTSYLKANNAEGSDGFGGYVATDGINIIVGAGGEGGSSGAAYIYGH